MLRIFVEEKVFSILMLAGIAVSIFLRVLLGLLYRKMIREADNMAITDNKMLKQCKLKFANCYQLGNGVANIPVFVDKFLNRLSLGPLSFEMMYHLSGQAILLSVVFAGVGICRCIMKGWTLGEILPFYIVSFMGLYLYFSISTVVDVRGKKRILKVNLVDYLENHLSPRINVTREDMEMLYGEAYEYGYQGARAAIGAYGPAGKSGNYKGKRGARNGNGTKQIAGPKESRSVRRGRNKTGEQVKRTVELMPIGNRLMAVPEQEEDYREDYVRNQASARADREDCRRVQTSARADREDCRRAQAPASADRKDYRRTEQTVNQENMYASMDHTSSPEAEKAWYMQEQQGDPEYLEGRDASPRDISPDDSAQVTEEELEALLKEFLAT